MKPRYKLSRVFYHVILIATLGFLWSGVVIPVYGATSDNDDPPGQVRLSWEEFKELLKIDTDEVRLSWDEFKKLLKQTGSEVKVEYNLQDGMVTLKRAQFKKLLGEMKGPEVEALKPPVDYLITKAEYSGVMKEKSTTFNARFNVEIFSKKRDNYVKIRLLPKDVALREIKLDNAQALIMVEDGWYVLTTDKVGQHVIDIVFSVKSDLDRKPSAINLTIPKTAITLFKIDIPLKDVKVKIPHEQHMTISHGPGHTTVEALLSTTNTIQVKLARVVVKDKGKGPAKIYAETMNLLSIEDDALRVTTKCKVDILQNAITQIKMYIPEGYSILYVNDQTGQEIRGWSTKTEDGQDMLIVPFDGQVEGTIIFTIVAEKIFMDKEDEIEFAGFQVLDALRQTGYIGAEKKSAVEAQIAKADNVDKVDILELPRDLLNMSTRPLIFGLRYLRHPFALSVKITKHEELPVVHTVIDNANVVSVFLDEGKVITRVVYTMQNTEKQFLELRLPEGAEIWSLYVGGQREIPSKNKDGNFMIPLARSKLIGGNIAPFNIEILYYAKNKKFTLLGSERLHFPQVDVVISKMLWSCYFPIDYQFIRFGGNVEKEKIATGLRPLLGSSRIFAYDDIISYNQALESWEKPEGGITDKRIKETQRKLRSEFKTSVANEQSALLSQLREEINFAKNVEREQGRGGTLLKIEIPTSGQLYRFAKTIVKEEDLYVDVQYMRGWLSTIFKIFFLLLIGVVIYFLRVPIKNSYVSIKFWVTSHGDLFIWLRSPNGTRLMLGLGAVIFWFLFKILFVVFVLVFLLAWLKPEWLFRHKAKAPGQKSPSSKS